MSLATSTSAKALQRSSADKCVYLYDGSLLVAYWNGAAGQVAQVTSPLTSPSVTNLFTTTEDGVSLWADNSSGTSSNIWVASSFDDASGSGPDLHVRSGTYTSGGGFSWNTSTSVPGTTQADTIQCTVTWNGTYLLVFLWDGVSGSDRLSYAYTADKTGQSGWTNERTLNGGTWSTIVQVAARHSAKLGATVITYGGNSRMFYGALPDGTLGQATGAAATETGTWSGTATTAVAAGIIAAVSPSGAAPVLSCGDVKQVRAAAGSVTASWGNGQQRTVGNLLVAAVSATGTTSAAAISVPSGWTQQATVGAGTAATCAFYTKTAAGADAAPAFTSTISGTATMTVQLLELVNASTSTPLDTSGSNTASGTVASLALTTSGNVANAGDYLLSVFVRERSAGTTTYTAGSGWQNAVNDGATSSTGHCSLDVKGAGPELNNWKGNGATGFYSFADNYTNFGGPQLVIDEATGDVHCARAMTTGGGPTNSGICYWHGTYSAGTVTWSSVLVIDADGGATTPADIGAAVDGSSALYVTYTDAATAGNLKYAKLVSPFTAVSSGPTVIVAGSGSVNCRWPHSPPVSASMGGLGTALPVLYANTFATPFPVLLDTSVTLPGGAVSGAASLAGSGALTVAGQFASDGALTGTGSLAAAGRLASAAALAGSGSLAAAPQFAQGAGLSGTGSLVLQVGLAAALSGSGSLSAGGALAGAAGLSGAGTFSAAGPLAAPAVLSGSGSLSAASALAEGTALSGAGSLSAAGQLPSAAALSGTGSLSLQVGLTPALTGTGTLSAAGTLAGAAGLAGTGSLTAGPAAAGLAALSGSGSLAAAGSLSSGAALAGAGSLSAAGQFTSAAALSGTGSLHLGIGVATALAGAGTLAAAAQLTAAAGLSGAGTLAAAGQLSGVAALAGSGSLSAGPQLSGTPALSGAGSLSAAGQFAGSAALSGAGSLVLRVGLAAALSGSGSLTATYGGFIGTLPLTGTGSLAAAPVLSAGAVLAGSGALSPGAQLLAAATLSGSGSLAGLAQLAVTALLSGSGSLTAGLQVGLAAALSGTGALAAAGQHDGAAALAGSGTLAAAGQSGITLSGSGSLSTGSQLPGTQALSGTGALTAGGLLGLAVQLSGSGSLGALPGQAGAAGLSGTGLLAAQWAASGAALAALAGAGSLSAAYMQAYAAAVALSGSGSLLAQRRTLTGVLGACLAVDWLACAALAASRPAGSVSSADRFACYVGADD